MSVDTGIDHVPRFQVFLSFRGVDVRRRFVSFLHRELSRKGITSFLDEKGEEEKDRGRQVSPSLLHAISESKVALVVLSKCYASSTWCLDELDKIMSHARKKLTPVIPIYYDVNSSDVKHQRGIFWEEFEKHGQDANPETLQRWRDALIKLTDKLGFSHHDSKDDSKLVREITRHVSGLLSESRLQKELLPGDNKLTAKKTSPGRLLYKSDQCVATISYLCNNVVAMDLHMDVMSESRLQKELLPGDNKLTATKASTSRLLSMSDQCMDTISYLCNNLVAMDRHMEVMYDLLELQSTREIRKVGISGVTGIGKTTIAGFVHHKLSPAFQSHCFLDTSRITNDLSSLYQKSFQDHYLKTSKNSHDQGLVSRVSSLGLREELPSPRGLKRKALETSSVLGSDDKRTMFWNQRALVIVDNVETITQLEEIMKDVSWLGPGSRVIITTQDKSLLLACGVEHVYEVDYLRYDEALELFSQCAFKKQYPPANFEELSVRAVQLSGCLPLGLKLLGSFLCGKTKEDWESEVEMLEAKQDEAIVELLKISAQGVPHGRSKEDRECEVQMLKKNKKIKPFLNY